MSDKEKSLTAKVNTLFPRDIVFGFEEQTEVELNYNICFTMAWCAQEIAKAIRESKNA